MPDALSALVARMTPACRGATARAANMCVALGHHEVDVEHVLLAMIETRGCDLDLVLSRLGNVSAEVRVDLEKRLQVFRSGRACTPVFAGFIPSLFEQADVEAGAVAKDQPIRTGHVLLALIGHADWQPMLERISPQLAMLDVQRVREVIDTLGADGIEVPRLSASHGIPVRSAVPAADSPGRRSGGDALSRFTVDLTARARAGLLDPVVGRERETLQLINILCRRRQNNPILVGDAGVGKTAVVEGLALAIARGQVPELLKAVEIRSLDMGLLQAGASVKGEFEARLRDLLSEVAASTRPIVIFIDEAHTLIGAGGAAGQNDAANLLKPALARGELHTIAATTWAEYKLYVEKDAALSRRFQPVKIAEPDLATAEDMLRAVVPSLELHSGVRILDDAVRAAVALSARYIADRQLPDKAIALLDTAVARVMLSRCDPHPDIGVDEALLSRANVRVAALSRDAEDGVAHSRLLSNAVEAVKCLGQRLEGRRTALTDEQELLAVVQATATSFVGETNAPSKRREAIRQLARVQGVAPMLPRVVDANVVAAVVAEWTGIPVTRMAQSDAEALIQLEGRLAQRVVGQGHALTQAASRVRTARSGLGDSKRPQGIFLFVGPSGVGKTETALALAEVLTGSDSKLITVNMSEYQEAHSVSGLKGAPAGYVGYGEGGTLTEAIRRQPYSVLLLDEVEKAHPDVLELFYQVFDRGYMADAEGREIDFRQTTIVLTSNVGSASVMQACLNIPDASRPKPDALLDLLRPSLYQSFKPAFLGRTVVIPYYPLTDLVLEEIIRKRMADVAQKLEERNLTTLVYSNLVIEWVLSRCKEADAGARDAIRLVDGEVIGVLATEMMASDVSSDARSTLKLSVGKGDNLVCKLSRAVAGEKHAV